MVAVADAPARDRRDVDRPTADLLVPATALVVGVLLCWTTRVGATALLVAVAVVQAALAVSWVPALHVPGRKGAVVLAALAAAAADVTVSVWPHSRLGPLLAVVALAVPALMIHQLWRGAARVRVVESLGGIALLIITVIAPVALLQLRHEFQPTPWGADPVFAVCASAAAALVVAFCIDLVATAPRFDPDVPRGLTGVLVATAVGAVIGYFGLRDSPQFIGGRGVFVGAAAAALTGLLAVAVAFALYEAVDVGAVRGRYARAVLAVLVPVGLTVPVALLLCLSIRA